MRYGAVASSTLVAVTGALVVLSIMRFVSLLVSSNRGLMCNRKGSKEAPMYNKMNGKFALLVSSTIETLWALGVGIAGGWLLLT